MFFVVQVIQFLVVIADQGMVRAGLAFNEASVQKAPKSFADGQEKCEALIEHVQQGNASGFLEDLASLDSITGRLLPDGFTVFQIVETEGGYRAQVRWTGAADCRVRELRASFSEAQVLLSGLNGARVIVSAPDSIFRQVPIIGTSTLRPQEGFAFLRRFDHVAMDFTMQTNTRACEMADYFYERIREAVAQMSDDEIMVLPALLSCWEGNIGRYPVAQFRRLSIEDGHVFYVETLIQKNGWVKPIRMKRERVATPLRQATSAAFTKLRFGVEFKEVPDDRAVYQMARAPALKVPVF